MLNDIFDHSEHIILSWSLASVDNIMCKWISRNTSLQWQYFPDNDERMAYLALTNKCLLTLLTFNLIWVTLKKHRRKRCLVLTCQQCLPPPSLLTLPASSMLPSWPAAGETACLPPSLPNVSLIRSAQFNHLGWHVECLCLLTCVCHPPDVFSSEWSQCHRVLVSSGGHPRVFIDVSGALYVPP